MNFPIFRQVKDLEGGVFMNDMYYLSFPVFYQCVIKGHTAYSQQNDIINILMCGCLASGITALDDQKCSRYATGSRPIARAEIKDIKVCSSVDIYERIEKLSIQNTDCLNAFFSLVKKGVLILDKENKERFLTPPANQAELNSMLVELFLYSINCPKAQLQTLSKDDCELLNKGFPEDYYTPSAEPPTMNDTQSAFVKNFEKTLFWSSSEQNSLKNLYIYNSYTFKSNSEVHDDLEELIEAAVNGKAYDFLINRKNAQRDLRLHVLLITGAPGCGKTSLISKIAYKYADKRKTYFVNMANMDSQSLSVNTLAEKLKLHPHQLKNSVLILDSLDEAIKHSENSNDVLESLCEEFKENGIFALITCRTNLINSGDLRHCFEISLEPFGDAKAFQWLENYQKMNPNFHLSKWKAAINRLDKKIKNVLLIPLILNICVSYDIDISTLKNLGQLYDILFDPVNGQIAIPAHREKTNLSDKDWKLLRGKVSDIAVKMFRENSITADSIVQDDFPNLYRHFGLDFYVDKTADDIRFAHSSIWQYFVAERIYKNLIILRSKDNVQSFIDNMTQILIPSKTLDNMILTFIRHFAERDAWKPATADVYKDILLHIPEYNIIVEGNSLEWIACIWREFFKIFSFVFKTYHPTIMDTLFKELSSDENQEILVQCSNLTKTSPIMVLTNYSLKNCTFNRINFANAYLKVCPLRNSVLKSANFSLTNMGGAYADHCILDGSSFVRAYLDTTQFQHSSLIGCDFTRARLNGADLSFADISYSDLRNATINKIILNGTKVYNCKISLEHVGEIFNLALIRCNNIHVYDKNNQELSEAEIEKYYYDRHPVVNSARVYCRYDKYGNPLKRES